MCTIEIPMEQQWIASVFSDNFDKFLFRSNMTVVEIFVSVQHHKSRIACTVLPYRLTARKRGNKNGGTTDRSPYRDRV